MSNDDILGLYESVAAITNQMLEAAKQEDWTELAALEAQCREYVSKMQTIDKSKPLSGPALQKKLASVNKILADDREIRNLTDPWMVKLAGMLHANGGERSLPA